MENNNQKKIGVEIPISENIPKYKKFWYSCTKFERYPEMASTGVSKAIGYLVWLMFIFSLIIVFGLLIKFNMVAKQGIKFLNDNFEEINYNNGELTIVTNIGNTASSSWGDVIINTEELTQEQINEYEKSSTNKPRFIWLRDRVISNYGEKGIGMYYKDVFDQIGLNSFNKTRIINFLNDKINSPQIYVIYGIVMLIYTFLVYFITTLIDILILSLFGMITTLIARLKIRYRAIFNMSVYAMTLSIVLKAIYLYIQMFSDFNIKYFDLMYTTIAFICLAAAIFMIRSDIIKQQLELMKIIEIKKQEQQEQQENKKEDEEKKEEEKEKDSKNKDDEEKEKDKKEEGKPGLDAGV